MDDRPPRAPAYRGTVPGIVFVAILVTLATASGCRREVDVAFSTRVYAGGGCDREIVVKVSPNDEGDLPATADAVLDAARLVEERPFRSRELEAGRAALEGWFPNVEELRGLTHRMEGEAVRDRVGAAFSVDDLVIAVRRRYVETYGDPYGAGRGVAAFDALLDLAVEILRDGVDAHLGADVSTARLEGEIRGAWRSTALELLAARARFAGSARTSDREAAYRAAFDGGDMPLAASDHGEFWDVQVEPLLGWTRARAADLLSTEERPVVPEQLDFWPVSIEDDRGLEPLLELVRARYGSEEAFEERLEPLLRELRGRYGQTNGPQLRFSFRVSIPGRLVRTSGMPDALGDPVWFVRGVDLAFTDAVFDVETIEWDAEALRTLGARTDFDPSDALRVIDLLTTRDPRGQMKRLLATAVDAGSLDPLCDPDRAPAEQLYEAVELCETLSRDP